VRRGEQKKEEKEKKSGTGYPGQILATIVERLPRQCLYLALLLGEGGKGGKKRGLGRWPVRRRDLFVRRPKKSSAFLVPSLTLCSRHQAREVKGEKKKKEDSRARLSSPVSRPREVDNNEEPIDFKDGREEGGKKERE